MSSGTQTINVTLPRPHPSQAMILGASKRFNVLACGRRFGKTTHGINRLVRPALAGNPVGWFAPTFKYLSDAWREFIKVLNPVIVRSNETHHRMELITGGSIEFWSMEDEDAGRSRKYARVVIDEAAKVKGLQDRWGKAIRPTLTDLKGDADFYSTPRGHDFFWRAFTWGQDKDQPEWASWQLPTIRNPFIDPSEVEAARLQLPERVYEQEYLAKFLDDAGGVFRKVADSVDRGRWGNLAGAVQGDSYSVGVDLARVEDFTVITVIDNHGRQVYHDRFNQISWERQIAAIVQAVKPFNAIVYVDSTGVGDPIYERLLDAGLDAVAYQFTNASKRQLIDNLAMVLEQGRLRMMDVPEQENELQAYAYEVTAARNVRTSAPEGMHDDCVISLALAAWGAFDNRIYVDRGAT